MLINSLQLSQLNLPRLGFPRATNSSGAKAGVFHSAVKVAGVGAQAPVTIHPLRDSHSGIFINNRRPSFFISPDGRVTPAAQGYQVRLISAPSRPGAQMVDFDSRPGHGYELSGPEGLIARVVQGADGRCVVEMFMQEARYSLVPIGQLLQFPASRSRDPQDLTGGFMDSVGLPGQAHGSADERFGVSKREALYNGLPAELEWQLGQVKTDAVTRVRYFELPNSPYKVVIEWPVGKQIRAGDFVKEGYVFPLEVLQKGRLNTSQGRGSIQTHSLFIPRLGLPNQAVVMQPLNPRAWKFFVHRPEAKLLSKEPVPSNFTIGHKVGESNDLESWLNDFARLFGGTTKVKPKVPLCGVHTFKEEQTLLFNLDQMQNFMGPDWELKVSYSAAEPLQSVDLKVYKSFWSSFPLDLASLQSLIKNSNVALPISRELHIYAVRKVRVSGEIKEQKLPLFFFKKDQTSKAITGRVRYGMFSFLLPG